jgi:hypothetical protein
MSNEIVRMVRQPMAVGTRSGRRFEERLGLRFQGVMRFLVRPIRFQQRWSTEWGDFQFAPEELIDLGDGRVFMRGRTVGSGLTSGAGFDSDWAVLLTFSGGRIVRDQFFFDREEALEAVGLRE